MCTIVGVISLCLCRCETGQQELRGLGGPAQSDAYEHSGPAEDELGRRGGVVDRLGLWVGGITGICGRGSVDWWARLTSCFLHVHQHWCESKLFIYIDSFVILPSLL